MFLATSSEDGTIRLWGAKPQTGRPQEPITEKPANQTTLEKLLGTKYVIYKCIQFVSQLLDCKRFTVGQVLKLSSFPQAFVFKTTL